jgi:mannose-6-phosphate isomerase
MNLLQEYWMGAHESGPAILEGASPASLQQYINEHPSILGSYIRNTFRRLPYLFKILDVKHMLSIQVHPNKRSA